MRIMKMWPIQDIMGVQKVMGCLAALSRFISRLEEKALPIYHLLKKFQHFAWTPDAEEALNKLKGMLTSPYVLVPPRPTMLPYLGEPFLLYNATTT
jgi:hypothetical protein